MQGCYADGPKILPECVEGAEANLRLRRVERMLANGVELKSRSKRRRAKARLENVKSRRHTRDVQRIGTQGEESGGG